MLILSFFCQFCHGVLWLLTVSIWSTLKVMMILWVTNNLYYIYMMILLTTCHLQTVLILLVWFDPEMKYTIEMT